MDARLGKLTPARRAHCERVGELAALLCRAYREDWEEVARLAGRAHDTARELGAQGWFEEAARLGLDVGPEERETPVLLHGPVAAAWMEEAGVGTPAVWAAVRFHTTAAPGLDVGSRAVYVADGIEPGRNYPQADVLRRLAVRDLDQAYREVLAGSEAYLRTRGLSPHPLALLARAEAGTGQVCDERGARD